MLDFSDKPYRYFPPRRFWPTTRLIQLFNRYWHLPRGHRVVSMEVAGDEGVRKVQKDGGRLLFMPNHSTHSDAPIFLEALCRVGVTTQVMAAYDVFLRGRFDAWVMQRLGAFSVDRDGSDANGMGEARDTLMRGRHGLTIFPEGNVYLRNDRVTPFAEGAGLLGLRAAKELAKGGMGVWAVPVSIKATHVTDVREVADQMLAGLAKAVKVEVPKGAGSQACLRLVGIGALRQNLVSRGIEIPDTDDLGEIIESAGDVVLRGLEAKLEVNVRGSDSLIDRFRKVRRVIHQIRLDPARSVDHAAAAVWADEAMLAFRIISYETDYVAQRPTLDRYTETVEKLAEDIYSRPIRPMGDRHVFVRFGTPVGLDGYLERFSKKAREAIRGLTEDVECAVQRGLDEIAGENDRVGCRVRVE